MPSGPLFTNVGTATPPAAADTKSLTGVIPHYQVRIEVAGSESLDSKGKKIFPIIANLPERFNMEFTSQWDTPFARTSAGDVAAAKSGGKISADLLNSGLGATGLGKTLKSQSYQVWQESSPMMFNLELIFRAVTNSESDVREKHIALLKLAAPSTILGQGLRAPGPSIRNQILDSSTSRSITLYIGKYLRMKNVVVKSVSSDVTCLFDIQGIPQAMSIGIGVESFNSCFTTEDIDDLFMV